MSEMDLRNPLKVLGLVLFLHRAAHSWEEDGNQDTEAHQWRWRADLEVETMLQHADYSRNDCISMWTARVFKETIERCDIPSHSYSPLMPGCLGGG